MAGEVEKKTRSGRTVKTPKMEYKQDAVMAFAKIEKCRVKKKFKEWKQGQKEAKKIVKSRKTAKMECKQDSVMNFAKIEKCRVKKKLKEWKQGQKEAKKIVKSKETEEKKKKQKK